MRMDQHRVLGRLLISTHDAAGTCNKLASIHSHLSVSYPLEFKLWKLLRHCNKSWELKKK
jgi:hypothetical protein